MLKLMRAVEANLSHVRHTHLYETLQIEDPCQVRWSCAPSVRSDELSFAFMLHLACVFFRISARVRACMSGVVLGSLPARPLRSKRVLSPSCTTGGQQPRHQLFPHRSDPACVFGGLRRVGLGVCVRAAGGRHFGGQEATFARSSG